MHFHPLDRRRNKCDNSDIDLYDYKNQLNDILVEVDYKKFKLLF